MISKVQSLFIIKTHSKNWVGKIAMKKIFWSFINYKISKLVLF